MPSCLVYRSSKKQETYLFLPVGGVFDDLPDELRAMFGEPVPVRPVGEAVPLDEFERSYQVRTTDDDSQIWRITERDRSFSATLRAKW